MFKKFDPKAALEEIYRKAFSRESFRVKPGEYDAVIDKVSFSEAWKKGNGCHLILVWDLLTTLPEGVNKATAQQRISCDLVDGELATGPYTNKRLGDLQAQFGLNEDGDFKFTDFVGKSARVLVENQDYTDNSGQPAVRTEVVSIITE